MSDERRKAAVWPWIAALLIGLPVLYVASFGPTCALIDRDLLPESAMTSGFFKPSFTVAVDAPAPIQKIIFAWVEFCGGGYSLAEFIARKEFETAPYTGITGGLSP